MSGVDTVLDELAKVTSARPATEADTVAGVPPRWVAAPESTDEVAEVLRLAGQHDLAVVPRGAGTALDWGAPPSRLDVVLDTTRLRGVVEHAAGDLVVTVRAGTPLAELQQVVGRAGQQLALDAPLPATTVGGTVSTARSGPRRVLYGTPRDLLIGITFVRADGVLAHAGGKVVKNVAGYDFGKLLTGSFGTLGVITEAVFRLHPLPVARRVVLAELSDAESAGRAALAVLGSQLVPSAVELDAPPDGPVSVAVLVEGVAAGIPDRVVVARRLLGADAGELVEPPQDFGVLPFAPGGTGLKLTCSLTGVGPVLAAARREAARDGLPLHVRGSAAGVLHAGLPPGAEPARVAALVAALRRVVPSYDGQLTVVTAPAEVRDQVDLWGPVPGIELMRRLKAEMDPAGRLSPGRFVGGI